MENAQKRATHKRRDKAAKTIQTFLQLNSQKKAEKINYEGRQVSGSRTDDGLEGIAKDLNFEKIMPNDENSKMDRLLPALMERLPSPSAAQSPRPPKMAVLESYDRKALQDFVVKFERMYERSGKTIDIHDWASGSIIYKIKAHGVDISDTEAVIQHLKFIEKMQAEASIKTAMDKLRTTLKWPQACDSGEEAIQMFIFSIREILGPDKVADKASQKYCIKIVVQKLPEYFGVTVDNYKEILDNPQSIEQLSEALKTLTAIEDAHIRIAKSSKKTVNLAAMYEERVLETPTKPPTDIPTSTAKEATDMNAIFLARLEQLEKQYSGKSSSVICYNCGGRGHMVRQCTEPRKSRTATPKKPQPYQEIRIRQTDSAPVRFVEMRNDSNKWTKTPGILDSGSGRTVGSLQLHKRFCGAVQPLRKNMKVVLGDNVSSHEVSAIGTAVSRVKVDDMDPVHLGEVRIFLIDNPDWKNLYIGREVLAKLEALPEQVLRKLSPDERAKLGDN